MNIIYIRDRKANREMIIPNTEAKRNGAVVNDVMPVRARSNNEFVFHFVLPYRRSFC